MTHSPRCARRPRGGAAALAVLLATGLGGCGAADRDSGDATGGSDSPAAGNDVSSVTSPPSRMTSSTAPTPRSALPPVVPVTPPGGAANTADPRSLPAPYVSAAAWADSPYGRTLQVTPTDSGRRSEGAGDADIAWREVLRLRPDADTPGMHAQFVCHWDFARGLEPDKPTWNLEPWRPNVDALAMVAAGCNPGGPEV